MSTAVAAPRGGVRASAVLLLPLAFAVEVVLGGPFGVYFGVPVRYALFLGSFAALLLAAVQRAAVHRQLAGPAAAIAGFVAVQSLWATVVPAVAGTNVSYAVLEFRPLLLLLVPALVLVVCGPPEALERALRVLQRTVVGACLVLAVVQISIWVVGSLLPQFQTLAFLFLGRAFAGAEAFLYVGPMPDGFFRVFWISSTWHPVAYFWAPAVARRRTRLIVVRAVIVAAIFVSYSRGIWLGLALGLVVASAAAIPPERMGREIARRAAALGIAAVAFVPVLAATGQLDRAVDRLVSTAPRQVGQEDERVQQVAPLLREWERSPLFGGGYGAYARDYVRVPETPYSYENTTYALLAKLGALGMAAFAGGGAWCAALAWRARRRAAVDAPAFLGAFTTTLVASTTNPMLLNFVGMSIVAALLFQFSWVSAVAAGPDGGRRAGR